MIKQISVFIENTAGRLEKVLEILGENEINIRSLTIAETATFGVLRLIVNDPERASSGLKAGGFLVQETEVLAIEIPDRPLAFAEVLRALAAVDINIEYTYSCLAQASGAVIIIRVDDVEGARRALQENGTVRLLSAEELYGI